MLTSLMQVNGVLFAAEALLAGRGEGVCMSHNVVVVLPYEEWATPLSVFNLSLCRLSPFYLDLEFYLDGAS